MPSIIKFLERLGTDAQLRHASQDELAKVLEESQVDAALGAAIIAHSTSADELYALLGLRPMFHIQADPGQWPFPLPVPGVGDKVEESEKKKAAPAEQAAI